MIFNIECCSASKEKGNDKAGQKFDDGKLEMGEFFSQFPKALEGLCIVAQYGKNKYSEGNGNVNFKEVPNAIKRYKDAMVRHMMAYLSGEYIDKESKKPHLFHLMWNVSALIELEQELTRECKTDIESCL